MATEQERVEFKVLGKPLARKDALAKVTGQATYAGDTKLHGTLVGKILRSPHPHAVIRHIDTTAAAALPGVRAIITAADTNKKPITFMLPEPLWDKLPLADGRVRFIGEEVAAVAAEDEATANEALRLIAVDYEPLPASFSVAEATAPEAAPIHTPGNLVGHYCKEVGNVAAAFREADLVVEESYALHSVTHGCLETHGALAQFDQQGKLTIWSTTQAPYYLQYDMARQLDIPIEQIRVAHVSVGAGFGSKSRMSEVDVIAALLARKTGRPVRIVLSREEEFACTRMRHPHWIKLTSAVRRDGKILGLRVAITIDNGAYNDVGPALPQFEAEFLSGLYGGIKNLAFDGTVVSTNKNWGGRYRAYGSIQITYAMECHVDTIAERLALSPVAVRLANVTQPYQTTPMGWPVGSCGLRECIERVAKALEENRSSRPNTGIGLACLTHVSGWSKGEYSSAIVKWGNRGITLFTGCTEIGQGSSTALAMILAEALGIDYDAIRVVSMDTEITPLDLGSRAQRVTFVAGNAILLAAEDVKRQLLARASAKLGVPLEELSYRDGKIVERGAESKTHLPNEFLSGVGSRGGFELIGQGVYSEPAERGEAAYVFACQGAEVAVDPDTGQVEVLRFVAAHDVGRTINVATAEGQVQGAIVQGIGFLLSEELKSAAGRLINASFTDYKMLRAADVPPIAVSFVETEDPFGPFGAKGLGESAITATAPAIANAIANATGVKLYTLPATAEQLRAALRAREGAASA